WFPWSDRVSCTLDLATSLPRSVLSEADTKLITWLLRANGVVNVPTVRQIKSARGPLDAISGIQRTRFMGAFGHPFWLNSMGDQIKQEFANPCVRPHMRFYPEEGSPTVEEPWHGEKWRKRLPPEFATPMIRVRNKDFYVHEPLMLHSGEVVMAIRWFTKHSDSRMWGHGWRMSRHQFGDEDGWIVHEKEEVDFCEDELQLNVLNFQDLHLAMQLPAPFNIYGACKTNHLSVVDWKYKDVNEWRTRAAGKRVLMAMIWLYCDDTSGNRSKKWNAHNSFLFTPANLSRDHTQKQYNVHFVCTSNLAPPLEMLEGVVAELEKLMKEGMFAWDCELEEEVMFFITVLGFLGDNPMQSEFACHIGLKGKKFCRCCEVQGRDRGGGEADNDADSDDEDLVALEGEAQVVAAKIVEFIQGGQERSPIESVRVLVDLFNQAKEAGTMTARAQLRTSSGVKDTFLNYFIDKLDQARKGKSGPQGQAAVDRLLRDLPQMLFSSVWRIPGLNPHLDTPTEILHVILLGIVKYFWRDAMTRLTADQKTTVIYRLQALDIDGLGPDVQRLSGVTYVQYAGSLVGRDFRVIGQVAIFVLYDMLPAPILAAWASLSKLMALAWLPVIKGIDAYLDTLTAAIEDFLVKTALWNPKWFNKPKFHILRHLPQHIRAFGPAILFATEGLESFNATIREWSIHSSRQAPSKDIGVSAARAQRLRHLMSCGSFVYR
ncbi:hypothetical protein SISNIDRAFT_387475, partial [Sistotremastrum niveocremeum HHB9708]